MTIDILGTSPLVIIIDEKDARDLETIDAGAAYTEHLHKQVGSYSEEQLGRFVDVVSQGINPVSKKYSEELFEYVDLREVDDIYGQILKFRNLSGSQIGSTKTRFQKGDILFAKIMPSLANKKICVVTQDATNAVASTEFIVLRKKPESDINLFYLFRALRSDHFNRQAVARVSGATGRQRISPPVLLSLKIIVPPKELQDKVGAAVEREITLRTLAYEQARRADDEAILILGSTTLRISGLASSAVARRDRRASRGPDS